MRIRSAARFLTTPENRSAWAAVQELMHGLTATAPQVKASSLFLHGPTGTGKTLLITILASDLLQHHVSVCVMSANDFAEQEGNRLKRKDDAREAVKPDLLVVEDMQHLPIRCAETLVQILDERTRRGLATVCTALCGPAELKSRGTPLPQRLTTRLAGGLVVALEPMQAPSRHQLLQALATDAHIRVGDEIIDWLAKRLTGGGRQIEGAVRQLKALQRLQKKPLRLEDIRAHFQAQVDAIAPTVQRITKHVCAHYHVKPRRLMSEKRSHDVLMPRQLSMYLARQLTGLSLEQIGRYFGGRDHKTVQHACKKVETALKADRALFGVIRKMRAELS